MSANFSFTVDEPYNKAHNEMFSDAKRLKLAAFIFALIFIVLAIAGRYLWGPVGLAPGVVAAVSLCLIPAISKQVGTGQSLYDRYELVPAMIAKVNPRDLIVVAYVNAATDPNGPAIPALAARTITNLEGHQRKKGERIPSVAVVGRQHLNDKARFQQVSPMPIAWATPDASVVKRARQAIPEKDWVFLKQNISRVDEILRAKNHTLFL